MSACSALDYGSARCGCALSDPSGTIVTPIEAIPRPGRPAAGCAEIEELIREREVERVVDRAARLAARRRLRADARDARVRAGACRCAWARSIPVELHDERFTTRIARQDQGSHRAGEDSRAAAHMLESWLHARLRQGS